MPNVDFFRQSLLLHFLFFSYCTQDRKDGISNRTKTVYWCMNRWTCDNVRHWRIKPNLCKTIMSPQSYVVVQDANDNRLFAHQKNYPEPTSKRFQKEKNLKITRETDGKMSSCYGKAAVGRRSEHRLSRFYSTKFCNTQGGCIKISENITEKITHRGSRSS